MEWRPNALSANLPQGLAANLQTNLQNLHPEAVRSGLAAFVDGSALRRGLGAMPSFGRGGPAPQGGAASAGDNAAAAPAGGSDADARHVSAALAMEPGTDGTVRLQLRVQPEAATQHQANKQQHLQQPGVAAPVGRSQCNAAAHPPVLAADAAAAAASSLPGMLGGFFGRQRSGTAGSRDTSAAAKTARPATAAATVMAAGAAAADAAQPAAAEAQAVLQAVHASQPQPALQQPSGVQAEQPSLPDAAAAAAAEARTQGQQHGTFAAAAFTPLSGAAVSQPPPSASPPGASWLGLFR